MSEDVVCGWNAVLATIERRAAQIDRVWIASRRDDKRANALESAARAAGVRVERADANVLDEHAQGVRHQGVVARLRPEAPVGTSATDLSAILRQKAPLLFLVLDGVQDPHNLGACMRSAAAAGAQAVIVPRDHSAPLSPVAKRAAAGAAEMLPLIAVANLARTLDELKEAGVWVFGASQDAKKSLYETDLTVSVALVLGGEGAGLRRLTQETCDDLYAIPMRGPVESLNISVAAGVSLFETCRQRSQGKFGKS